MSWIIPENKLDDQQRQFIDNVDIDRKNIWIKGFPGSGKSVLLAHTVRRILNKNPHASIIMVVFTQSLVKMFQAAFREMKHNIEVVTIYEFMKSSKSYDYVLCDEVQDLTPRILSKMSNSSRHIVVAGDSNQSIYEQDPSYREHIASSSEIQRILSSEDYELGIIHRLSKSIINVVQKFLPKMNIFNAKMDLTKQTTQVRICEADNRVEEVKYIIKKAKEAINNGQTVAILLPSQKMIVEFVQEILRNEGKSQWSARTNQYGKMDFGNLNSHCSHNNIPLQYIGNGYGGFSENSRKITLMTYHSAKGLDFDNVFLPYLNNSFYIVSDESLSKTLFMVAMTRSKNNLFITYSGYRHNYLEKFYEECHRINIHDTLYPSNGGNLGGFASF